MFSVYPAVCADHRSPSPLGDPLAVLLLRRAKAALRARRLRKARESRAALCAHRPSSAQGAPRLAGV